MYHLKILLLFLSFLFFSCGSNSETNDSFITLSPDTTWYIQLEVDNDHPLKDIKEATVYDIDLFDASKEEIQRLKEEGKIVICYFSAGTYEDWRPDKDRFPLEVIGNPYEGWEGEYWLDIRNEIVKQIMIDRLKLAKEKGCDGVDPDNVNGYENNTGFNLTYSDQIDFNKFLSEEAHKLRLLIGLKNDLNQINDLVDFFDFSVNEECHQYNECDLLMPFIQKNKSVFNIEYDEIYINDETAFQNLCEDAKNRNFRTLVMPYELDGSFVKSCDYGEY
ncbi:MAG: endo alpha-1,4 polygalactosaminidase [Aquificota bacterium]|nr:MAG: endo alpha-1,4 polygalactosaminidase [Aquificota bacterium]